MSLSAFNNARPHQEVCGLVKHPVGFEMPRIHNLLHALDVRGLRPVFSGVIMNVEGADVGPDAVILREQALASRYEIYAALEGACYHCRLEERRVIKLALRLTGQGFYYYECPLNPAHIGQIVGR